MKTVRMLAVCLMAAAPAMMAQRWEVGGGAGGGFYTSQDVSLGSSSVSAKVASNIAGTAWLANNSQNKIGGELRFDYQLGALQLNGDGSSASFAAHSYGIHYDVVYHFAPNGSKIRPFVSAGAGIKVYQGTGSEVAYQPLQQFALLTKAQDLVPLISGGAGVKVQLASRLELRLEVHDYATPFPKQVITPNSGAKAGGWLMDFVPTVGIAYTSSEGR